MNATSKQAPVASASRPVQELAALVADHTVLYQKLRGYHWNVKGPWFFTLHARFEELYRATSEQVDALAERMVALGRRPPSTLAEVLATAELREDGDTRDALAMVRSVTADLERLSERLRAEAGRRESDDPATAELLVELAASHEGELWMLRAFLAA